MFLSKLRRRPDGSIEQAFRNEDLSITWIPVPEPEILNKHVTVYPRTVQ